MSFSGKLLDGNQRKFNGVLRNQHDHQQRAAVDKEGGNSGSFTIDNGVRKGCILSPTKGKRASELEEEK